MLNEFASAFFKLMVIMDAFGVLPLFLLLSEKLPKKQRVRAADRTIVVATILMLVFLFSGLGVLNYFGISLGSFQIAGGLILFILGVEIVLGLRLSSTEKEHIDRYEFSSVPMATPLIVGPGTITTLIILVGDYGHLVVLFASIANLFLMWIVFRHASQIYKFIGHQGTQVISRLIGIVFTALAVEFVKEGILKLMA